MGQPLARMQGPNPAGYWGREGRGSPGPGSAQGQRGRHMGTGPGGPSLPPAAQQVHQGSVPVGHLHWGATALVLNPGCFAAAQDPLAEQDPQTWGNLRLLSFCSSPRPSSTQKPQWSQTPQQPRGSPRPLSTVAAQEPPVSKYLSGQGPCSPVPAQDPAASQGPTAPQGCHQLTLTGESPKRWCQRVTLQGLTRPPALPS